MRMASCMLHGRDCHEAGRELLRQLYREETGRELPPIHVAKRGKPYLADSEYHFSITHTRHHAFCVLARVNVGIDAEELDRPVSLRMAGRILSERELSQFQKAADPRRALLTFWVLKEAAVKLTGEGLRGFPNETDFSLSDPRVREWDGCLVAVLTEGMEGETRHAF